MEAGEQHQSSHARRQTKTTGPPKINIDLLTCREKAKSTHTRADCPRKPNGRKTGVMELTKIFWEEIGYANLGKTAQNLRDQAARIEKMITTDQQTIQNEIIEQTECSIQDNAALNDVEIEQRNIENPSFTRDEELDNHFKEIQEKAKKKYLDVKIIPGDWSRRGLSTYVKKKPTSKELHDLQGILMVLEMHSPMEEPTKYLWDVNCAMYATICGWKLATGDHKDGNNNSNNQGKQRGIPAWEKRMNEKMNKIRGKISQITEEIQRIRNNKKLTRNTRRSRR